MNMASKGKKKMVLPTRPDPPSVDQIIEDINRAESNDPVFRFLQIPNEAGLPTNEAEARYVQSRHYLELNERLQEARIDLTRRRDELRMVGESLEQSVAAVKGRAL
ncbi:UPF0449 protein C19orf25 homolog isoform X1 [Ictalurus furcatus]|uniref:UPF0449 protein C19orf25 homolog isoform X1 n=1 Tax=Ictalurus furcatus TaxID=66913 RepID=UPI00235067D3|nr:UPF0449 protein C19orf25 homolog isoform X1 [Ictalurus furcatus]XP_053491043.1 UPF0449 protein C19orf25 homolog isoform X1 [Ictalurus furcatus]